MKLHKPILLSIVAIVLTVGVSNAQVKQLISEQQLVDLLGRVDTSTDRFAKTADKAMDKAGFDGSARENDLGSRSVDRAHSGGIERSSEAEDFRGAAYRPSKSH